MSQSFNKRCTGNTMLEDREEPLITIVAKKITNSRNIEKSLSAESTKNNASFSNFVDKPMKRVEGECIF